MSLELALAALRNANRIDGTRASYRKDNPSEYQKVMDYLDGSPRPAGADEFSLMGQGLVWVEDERRKVSPPPPEPEPDPVWGVSLRQRFPKITPAVTVDDTGKPDRTSVVIYDGTSKHDILLKNITRRGGTGDGFKFSGGAERIEVRMCNAYDPGPNEEKPQLLNFQRAPKQIQVYGGEYAKVGHDQYSHFAYFGDGSTDILVAGVLGRDFTGYGLHGYPGPGSAVAANCTVVGSTTRSGAVVYPGFDLLVVNSILSNNVLEGITDRGGTWRFVNCCLWPRPANYTDSRFVNCIFENPLLDSNYRPQNFRLADGGVAGWMAPHDYKGSAYTKRTIGAVAV